MDDYAARRKEMVRYQIAMRGLRSPAVLDAMRSVPREAFVPPHLRDLAYEDSPLPIAAGQTISQPYIVAYMIDALELEGGETVLDVGAGSGYAAAVLSRIAGKVHAIERIGELAEGARDALHRLGYDNVEVRHGDGSRGWPEQAPFDAIVVAAGGPGVPESLKHQLKIGGRLVIPTGAERETQALKRVRRVDEEQFDVEQLTEVRFVPLLGEEGWNADSGSADLRPRRLRRPVQEP